MRPKDDTSDVTVIRPTLAYVLDSTLLPLIVCAAPIALVLPGGSSRPLVLMAMALVAPVVCILVSSRLLKIKAVVTESDVTFHAPDQQIKFKIGDILGYEIERNKAETYLVVKQEFEKSEKICISGMNVKRLLREINKREE